MWWQKYMVASLKDMPVQYPTPMCGLLIPFLLILIQVSSCTVTVTGYIGQDVTLPCSYDVQANGVLSFCWGHGQVPRSKCSNTILSSDHGNVTFRGSPRYQLLSQAMQGDVSLTIIKAQKTDSGVYGCRVEIPGWFNDQKINVHLTMEEAPMEELDIQSSTEVITVTVSKDCLLDSCPAESQLTLCPNINGKLSGQKKCGRNRCTTNMGSKIAKLQSATSQVVTFSLHENFKALLEAENIGRTAAIFFLTLILILILIIRRKVLMGRKTPQQLNITTAENIYETIPMTK